MAAKLWLGLDKLYTWSWWDKSQTPLWAHCI